MPIWLQIIALILAVTGVPINVACLIFAWRASVDADDCRQAVRSAVPEWERPWPKKVPDGR